MLRRYCELDVDDFVGDYASLTVTGEPWEVALVAQGLLGDRAMRLMVNYYGIDHDFSFPIPDYEKNNGIAPTNTMLIAAALATSINSYTFVAYTKPHDWRMYQRHDGQSELYIEASASETRRLDAMLTTDEGWYS